MIRLALLGAVVAVVAYAVWRWRRDRREDGLARARSAFFLVTPLPPDQGPSASQMRTFSVGGGLLGMRIPDAWEEQPAVNAYRALASSGRLFQSEVHRRSLPGGRFMALKEELEASPEGRKGRLDVLPNDRALLKHVRDGASGAPVGLTYCWTLAAARPDDTALVAEVSFSVPLEAADAITLDDLALLEREVRDAEIPSAPGIEDNRPA